MEVNKNQLTHRIAGNNENKNNSTRRWERFTRLKGRSSFSFCSTKIGIDHPTLFKSELLKITQWVCLSLSQRSFEEFDSIEVTGSESDRSRLRGSIQSQRAPIGQSMVVAGWCRFDVEACGLSFRFTVVRCPEFLWTESRCEFLRMFPKDRDATTQ